MQKNNYNMSDWNYICLPNKTDSAHKKKNYSTGFVCSRPALLAANLKTIPTLKKEQNFMYDKMKYSHFVSCTRQVAGSCE
jgi:hypothetical protein